MCVQRTWIWENYYRDDQEHKDFWLAGAAALRRINNQVMEDIEDFIVLKGFTRDGRKLQLEAIERAINNDLGQRRARKAMEYAESGDRQEEETKDELTE